MFLSREQFLAGVPRPTEDVPLPEFGDGARVRVVGMTARERSAFEKQFQTKDGKPIEARQKELRERLLVACCQDEYGATLFTAADIEELGRQAAYVVERIVDVAMKLCGMKGADLEALAKNSDATRSDASP